MQWIWNFSWELATVLRVVIGFGLCQGVLIKLIAHEEEQREKRFLVQFSFTFAFACVAAFIDRGLVRFDAPFFAALAIGVVASFGTFLTWKAVAISQTRNALFTSWDDLIAMGLAWLVLGEENFITLPIAIGILLSFCAAFLFIRHAWKKQKDGGSTIPGRFYVYVATYSVLWGVAYFVERLWAFHDLPISEFLLGWYTGALLTAIVIYCMAPAKRSAMRMSVGTVWTIFLLATGIFVSMALTLPAYKAPQVVVQPIFFVSEISLPVLMALGFAMIGIRYGIKLFDPFKREYEQFDRIEWLYFAVGAAGALLIGLSFH